MTKKQLLELIAEYPDDAEIVINVHDTVLYEDLYDFTVDPISWFRFGRETDSPEESTGYVTMHELQLCPIKNTND